MYLGTTEIVKWEVDGIVVDERYFRNRSVVTVVNILDIIIVQCMNYRSLGVVRCKLCRL